VGRTQSAVSLQVQRLEMAVGHGLLKRGKGGAVDLTVEGRRLVAHAHRVLALNAELFASLGSPVLSKVIRFGAADYLAQGYLPEVMKRFGAAFPTVGIDLEHAPACRLVMKLQAGELDLMVGTGGCRHRAIPSPPWPRCRFDGSSPTGAGRIWTTRCPLSLPWVDCPWRPSWLSDCVWCSAALKALDRAGRRYRIVSTASSVAGQMAPVLGGLAVSVATADDLVPRVSMLAADEGMPLLPEHSVILLNAENPRQPVTDVLAAHIMEAFGVSERGPLNRAGPPEDRLGRRASLNHSPLTHRPRARCSARLSRPRRVAGNSGVVPAWFRRRR
jgi:DNA-binding transcriptional LysR family regulator